MTSSEPYLFFERAYPSANVVLLRGPRPVLVDTGFGSDVPELLRWLSRNGTPPENLALVVNTHYHSDHVGGNNALAAAGVEIAAHPHDADLINRRDASACAADWLCQPVEAYSVSRTLRDGDVIDTGAAAWRVIHTPGHTVGHLSLFEPTTGVLIAGDTAHAADVGWVNPVLEGADALERSRESVERLASLGATIAFSGHGPAILDPAAVFAAAQRRFERWQNDPEAAAWHAVKRILAYALMIEGGIEEQALGGYLEAAPWVADFAAAPFAMAPGDFANMLVEKMLDAGSIAWRDGRLVAVSPHTPTSPSWLRSPATPSAW